MDLGNRNKNLEYYILDESQLNIGDIILTSSSSKLSSIIRTVTRGEYSHVMLYVGGWSCIDSTTNGVNSHNILRILFSSKNDCKILRYRVPLSENEIKSIISFVRHKNGTSYSISEAVRAGIGTQKNNENLNRQFCSRLVAQAYTYAGLNIVKNSNYPSPEDIHCSEYLIEIEAAVRKASNDEMEVLNDKYNGVEVHQKSINYILKKSRKATRIDVQTFSQLNQMLSDFPEYDDIISELLITSGYLMHWEIDLKANPWIYDYSLFKKHFPDKEFQINLARKQLIVENERAEMFEEILFSHFCRFQQHELKSFALQIQLYLKLMDLNRMRIQVWEEIIKRH
ncbi:MAG: YiiX/YebB-like N1pC/P60 family cysteine hydrolase [Adhaeribacter sp.]